MAHIIVPEAEELLDQELQVLDHGFVRLVDYMGSDKRIVQAARVSYGPDTKTLRDDRLLIQYLLSNQHMSPFEQVVFVLHLKMPIFVARQLVRHRTARMNEISGRYAVMKEEFYLPEAERVRLQKKSNRQGSEPAPAPMEQQRRVLELFAENQRAGYAAYREMIDRDLTRELARAVLPLSLYTQMYWQMDLRNLLHFIQLRLDEHAQYEIRVYAEAMARIVRATVPMTWAAFEEYELHALRLSRSQAAKVVEALQASHPELAEELGLKTK